MEKHSHEVKYLIEAAQEVRLSGMSLLTPCQTNYEVMPPENPGLSGVPKSVAKRLRNTHIMPVAYPVGSPLTTTREVTNLVHNQIGEEGGAMNDRKINHTIASICGTLMLYEPGWIRAIPNPNRPDYVNDLNAMHEAEKFLNPQQERYFFNNLCFVCERDADKKSQTSHEYNILIYIHSTSRQRAEAFLRTIGKWSDPSVIPEGVSAQEHIESTSK